MGQTSIEWTARKRADGTWAPGRTINPIRARNVATGAVGHFCEKVSPACAHCYAEEYNSRTRPVGNGKLIGTGLAYLPIVQVTDQVEPFLDETVMQEPLWRREPTTYFWCSMTDLFLRHHPDEWILKCLAIMGVARHHFHIVLTKRAERMAGLLSSCGIEDLNAKVVEMDDHERSVNFTKSRRMPPWFNWDMPPILRTWPLRNVAVGVTAEDQQRADERLPWLAKTPAAVRFVSYEPALGPVDWKLDDIGHRDAEGRMIDGIIGGGESNKELRKGRPGHPDWFEWAAEQCDEAGVAYFHKQWGNWGPTPRKEGDRRGGIVVGEDGTVFQQGDLAPDGPRYAEALRRRDELGNLHTMFPAGPQYHRLLDGAERNDLPWGNLS
jgi:protein gp37